MLISIFHERKLDSVFQLSDEFWDVFISDLSESEYDSVGRRYDGFQENGIDYINYWDKSLDVIQLCYYIKNAKIEKQNIKEAEEIIEKMQVTFNNYGYFPRPPYKTYEYGWTSSMDAPVIMLASQMLYELTNEIKYQQFIEDIMEYVTLSTQEKGFNFIDKDGNIWPLEYAQINANSENSYFVLNGSLVGYISLKAMSKIIDNNKLDKYLKNVEKTYVKNFDKFHLKDNKWSRYMLNPSTVIPIHYAIFEEKLFRAAYYLNGKKEFNEEYQYRRNMLMESLRVEFYKKDDGYEYYLLRATSPNYYQIDTYSTLVEIYDKRNNLIEKQFMQSSGEFANKVDIFYDSMFIKGKINNNEPFSYKVYCINGNSKFLLFESNVEIFESKKINLNYNISVDNDILYIKDNLYKIDKNLSEKHDGRFIFELSENKLLHELFYAIEIENLSNEKYGVGLIIYDDKNIGISRYYTNLLPGKNLIVFDAKGFSDYDNLSNIKNIVLRIYNNDVNKETTNVKLGNLYGFNNLDAFYEYIMNTNYKINPQ